jgi:hypothetical protein
MRGPSAFVFSLLVPYGFESEPAHMLMTCRCSSLVPMTCRHLKGWREHWQPLPQLFLSAASYMLKTNWIYATSLHLCPEHQNDINDINWWYHFPISTQLFIITIIVIHSFLTLPHQPPNMKKTLAKTIFFASPGTMTQGRSHCACRLPGWSKKALCLRTWVDVNRSVEHMGIS